MSNKFEKCFHYKILLNGRVEGVVWVYAEDRPFATRKAQEICGYPGVRLIPITGAKAKEEGGE